MVARIDTGYRIRNTFYYNENKVKEGVAVCIHAENYPMGLADMDEYHKLNMLLKLAERNPNVRRSSVHISLNFAPGEQLSDKKLSTIATEYMERIGFGNQPYLVYRHEDAGHPHIHIASVKVRPDGNRIDMNNIGKEQSEEARLTLEKKYGLVPADGKNSHIYELKSAYTRKAEYGKSESKKAIQDVLNGVLAAYKYASLPELNAVLKLYNVMADRCGEGSRVYKNKGLLFRILDECGKPIGVPIKASVFYSNPTLAGLEKRFLKNDVERQKMKAATRNAIDAIMRKYPGTGLQGLIEQLGKKGVDMVLRENKDGVIYGITYVDHTTKCVFNGSALGKEYSAKAVLERCGAGIERGDKNRLKSRRQTTDGKGEQLYILAAGVPGEQPDATTGMDAGRSPLEALTRTEETYSYVPWELRKKKKKKRKGLSR